LEPPLTAPLSRRQLLAAGLALSTAGRASAVLPTPPLPPVVDLSALFGPARDQGNRMTCAYFATTAAAEGTLARATGMAMAFSEQFLTDIDHGGGRLPADETTDIGRVMELVSTFGMVPAAACPYRPDQAAGQAVQRPDATLLALGQPMRLEPSFGSTLSIENLQRRLLRRPLVIALALPADHAGWRDDGLVLPVPGVVPRGAARDEFPNHFVVLTGYDQRKQLFFFRNSWGPGWGRGGYGRIRFASMRTNWWTGDALYFLSPPARDRLPLGGARWPG
jgi:hypothetical protein